MFVRAAYLWSVPHRAAQRWPVIMPRAGCTVVSVELECWNHAALSPEVLCFSTLSASCCLLTLQVFVQSALDLKLTFRLLIKAHLSLPANECQYVMVHNFHRIVGMLACFFPEKETWNNTVTSCNSSWESMGDPKLIESLLYAMSDFIGQAGL